MAAPGEKAVDLVKKIQHLQEKTAKHFRKSSFL